jgi:hypothetical protein
MIYRQYTWGLGGKNDPDKNMLLDYNYLRLYHSLLKKISGSFFLGAGYSLDLHYNIRTDDDSVTAGEIPVYDYDLQKKTVSSGPVLNMMIDSRRNSINPAGGMYPAVDYRFNTTWLGSTQNWQSLFAEIRKYIPFEHKRQNILALWSYYWAITSGRAPYLDLPSIGWDNTSKSGRGFQQNQYRSKSLFYSEAEYRRDISRNGFWGFVLFANLHGVSEFETGKFSYWHPAAGFGLRVKFNKLSKTNVAIDAGFSKGYGAVYLTLGEVF